MVSQNIWAGILSGLGAALVLGLALGLGRVDPPSPSVPHFADGDDPQLVARGREIFQRRCASCHGAQGQGEFAWRIPGADGRIKAPPLDASGHVHDHGDAGLMAIIQRGEGVSAFMPRFAATLPEEDVLAVMAFMKSTWPLAIRIAQAAANPDRAGMPKAVDAPARATPGTCVTSTGRQIGAISR